MSKAFLVDQQSYRLTDLRRLRSSHGSSRSVSTSWLLFDSGRFKQINFTLLSFLFSSSLETGIVMGTGFFVTMLVTWKTPYSSEGGAQMPSILIFLSKVTPVAASNIHRTGARPLFIVGILVTCLGSILFGMVGCWIFTTLQQNPIELQNWFPGCLGGGEVALPCLQSSFSTGHRPWSSCEIILSNCWSIQQFKTIFEEHTALFVNVDGCSASGTPRW